ncbi:hypothetical protein L249_1508 [Ophiocordyceps polyrhachis-furcata BCC 54312]|uniref:Uncharacterized protein n=1 Tax=Ophiocordyceps polyrhachis-furcata BCC 54312 TaxID=1330021 RepID=A0A367L408_9HYPO|nr:hypothetical protein L249_1508 [Ophiocordyceps polyrhachis-furcata BCC 54312]
MKLKLIMNWNTMTWLYVTPFRSTTIEVGRYDRYWYSASIAVTITRADRCDGCLVPRSIGCYDRYRYSAPIAVTIAVTSRFGRYDRYSPTVTQGVVAGLRPNWYNLFQAGYSGPLCISLAGGNGLPYKMLCKPLGGCHGLSRLS